MKKGITPEAAQRLAAFLQKRAQDYQDTEEWSPGDAAQDVLWNSRQKIHQTFASPIMIIKEDTARALTGDSLTAATASFEETFSTLIEELNSMVAQQGFPVPDPAAWESLKERYSRYLLDLTAELHEQMWEAIRDAMNVDSRSYSEQVLSEFQKAAAGTPGGMVP